MAACWELKQRRGHPVQAMLRDRILAVIQASPGVSIGELKIQVPDAKAFQIHNALDALRKAKAIEATSYAHYRVPERRASSAGRTQTAPIARLMAGR